MIYFGCAQEPFKDIKYTPCRPNHMFHDGVQEAVVQPLRLYDLLGDLLELLDTLDGLVLLR